LPAKWAQYVSIPGNFGLPAAGAFLSAGILGDVRKLHRQRPVDLIHAHGALPCGHAALRLSQALQIPYVVSVHGLDAFSTRQVRGLAGRCCEHISRRVYKSARRVFCVSGHVAEEVRKHRDISPATSVVYNGVDPQLFHPANESGQSHPGPLHILSVGDLIPIKGHDVLLRALSEIHSEWPDVCCDIIGDGPERKSLQDLAMRLNLEKSVRFRGRQSREQVAEFMRRAAIFALPSRYEALGCVYLEAMSSAKPVIACQGQGIGEIIQHAVNGWLVNVEDVHQLAAALRMLLNNEDLRRKLGRSARETITSGFTLSHQAKQLAELYQECVL
jgi:glycosyltransferase involved in cell wall biosynthesis